MDPLNRKKCTITHSQLFCMWSQVYKNFWTRRQPDLMSTTSDVTERSKGAQAQKEIFVCILMQLMNICFPILIGSTKSWLP